MRRFTLAFDQDKEGRFIAEVHEIPGALAYGVTQDEAKVQAIALHALAERIGYGEDVPGIDNTIFDAAV